MAASVNNIAATFAAVEIRSSSSSSSSSLNQTGFPLPVSHKSICTKWNPHTTLPKSQRNSLINLYGSPGLPPVLSISTVHPDRHRISKQPKLPVSLSVGSKLPNVALSYLNRNDAVQTVNLGSLCKGKRVVLVGVSAAFSPSCSRFVKRVESSRSMGSDMIACVAINDVFVMRAWGENLAVGEKVKMLSDGCGELSKSLGLSVELGGEALRGSGVRSRRFCLCSLNGVITSVDFDRAEED